MSIGVIICEEQTFARAGIRALISLEADMKVLGEPDTSSMALTHIARQPPHVVLVGSLGAAAEIVSWLRERVTRGGRPVTGTIALVTRDEEKDVVDVLRAGVRGVVRKDGSPPDLIRAIRAVAAGDAFLTPATTKRLIDWTMRATPPATGPPVACGVLTRAELAVLRLLASGMTSFEAAERLSVTEATIRSHVHHILVKLGLRSRSQAVAYAYRHGIAS
ncbi:MAG TPA: response regulator transcription factor [Streptosporangiaceae bacterium]|nr:response regulator transcription factor [Streptosporangiaceae bacterium]